MMVSQNKQNLKISQKSSRVIQGVTKLVLHNTPVIATKPNFNCASPSVILSEGC